jgi:hypothetical protein
MTYMTEKIKIGGAHVCAPPAWLAGL